MTRLLVLPLFVQKQNLFINLNFPHFFIILLISQGLYSCSENTSIPVDEAPELQTHVYTDYSATTELFAEFPILITGEVSEFLAHFSDMQNFKPINQGKVTITLSSQSSPKEEFSIDTAQRPGIFFVDIQPKHAGKRRMTVSIVSDQHQEFHNLGEITVYNDKQSAFAAPHESEHDETETISFLKEQQWQINFETEITTFRAIQNSILAYATIKSANNKQAWVNAPIAGHLLTDAEKLPKIGSKVEKGDILATLSARLSGQSDLAELKSSLIKAKTNYQLALAEKNRLQQLYRDKAIAQKRLLIAENKVRLAQAELNQNQKRLEQIQKQASKPNSGIQIYAPISGTLVSSNAAAGSYLSEGESIYQIINSDVVWLDAQIAENDIHHLSEPDRFSFVNPANNKRFDLTVNQNASLISNGTFINPVSRTVSVIFEFNNSPYKLIPGQWLEVRIYNGETNQSLAIPESALIYENGQTIAFVHSSGEEFQRRIVETGYTDQGYVQIRNGLDKGDRVVTQGAYLIHLASTTAMADGAHGHAH